MTQPTIDWPEANVSLDTRFEMFHEEHPYIYDELVKMARQARARGQERIGIGMLWEVLRWRMLLDTDDLTSNLKLNNSYRSRYARRIMEREADLRGMFETRELRS